MSAQWTRLQRANAFKSEILGTVAHDLRNPLSVILGRTEMLTEMVGGAASSTESIQAQIVHIRTAANRVTEIINSLIKDAMADAHDITIRPEAIDVVALIKDIVEANQPLAARKDQSITVAAPDTLVSVCDPDRMREAVDNLLSNAIKYSPVGGRIEVGVAAENGRTIIRVGDEGPGLSPDDVARLFGRFQRLSARPTGGEPSTGLGLSIVKRIVDLHNGAVSVEQPARPAAPLRSRSRPHDRDAALVVVDDEAAAREMVGDYLRMHGFAVTLCDGAAGLRAVMASQRPDLIVLDLNMPQEDGLSVICSLKQESTVPVIMLTATAS